MVPKLLVVLLLASACATSSSGSVAGQALPARWWNWTESVPASQDPIDDPTGQRCAGKQSKDVWFLAGTRGGSATRTCTIPAGEPVYAPVLDQVCEPTPGDSAREAIERCSLDVDVATATLDGTAVPVKETDSGGVFAFVADADSQTMSEGRHDAVAWGLWVGPLTLAPGPHVLALKGVAGSFSTDVTYRLTAR